jgi:(4-O-methyl)-D-glucuronate---lignin esterase
MSFSQNRPRSLAVTFALLAMLSAPAGNARAADSLSKGFAIPPVTARPWVYWYFMDGNLTREGMTADLKAMKKADIGGAIFLEVNIGIPRGPVDFMSPHWEDLVAHAVHEADRLGIQIALATGPGWCGTGGPWITPELAMQDLVASATNVVGPASFSAELPRPRPREPFFGEGTLTPELKKEWQDFYRDTAVLAFRTPDGTNRIADVDEKALYYRAPFSSQPGVKPFLPAPAMYPALPAADCIQPTDVVDLTKRLGPDGHLDWQVPPGRWTIMRFGRTLTGQTTRPAPKPGLGFESDKFDRKALDVHFADYIQKLLAKIGPHTNPDGGLTMLHFDSWEMGSQNWSPHFRAEFKRRRGYDPLKYLPTLSGHIVGSPEISGRFLWDLRRTAQELIVENHVGYLKKLAHQNGLTLSIEPYDLNPAGDLTLGRVADVPQCEFWHLGFDTDYSVIEAASIGHTCGRSIVAAEAFTSIPGEDWKADPAALKVQGDWAFSMGVNRFDFHRFQAQPWTNRWPGMTMGPYGVHWDRTETWWDMVSAYHEYLARCQFLLQRGVTVADVCFLAGEGAPYVFRPPPSATTGNPPDHGGYDFDGCAPETLLERAEVKDGRIVFPGGTRYRLLVLPAQRTMTPALLEKIKSLVQAGATVFGPPPEKSPSLQNYPKCDATIQRLAKALWGDCDGKTVFSHAFGKGRVIWRKTTVQPLAEYGDFAAVTNVLKEMGVPPDFDSDGSIRFTHRRDGGTDIYFLANREDRGVHAICQFRVSGRQPELWDPMTGRTRALPQFTFNNGRTTIPLRFEPEQSFFVVFRKPPAVMAAQGKNFPTLRDTGVKFSGPWAVSFDPKWGGPAKITFPSLEDWSRRPEPGIKYYSGQATYRKSFTLPPGTLEAGRKYFLDLGVVKNLARVRLNGHDLGVVWCPPWRVDVTDSLKEGDNHLEIEVANLWPNRLIGDLSLPPGKQFTWTTLNPYKKNSPLLPSGLLGPVKLLETTSTAWAQKN